MTSLLSGIQVGLLRSLSQTENRFATALERISTGSRINSAADSVVSLSMATTLQSEIGSLNAQIASSVRVDGLLSTTSAAVDNQIDLLQDARELAVSAASSSATSSDRTTYQSTLDGYISDFDLIATSTSFGGRHPLDGSMSTQSFNLGGLGDASISVSFMSTRASAIGQVAEVSGSTVTTTALAAGDVTINGIAVDASIASDDTVSTSDNAASAIATAAAINRADTGVTASAQATSVNLGAISAGSLSSGDLTINGVDIGAVTALANDSDSALSTAINNVTSSTGVTAALNASNELVLTAADGRNIVTAGANTSGGGVIATDPGSATHTGSIVLTSSDSIVVAGNAPASAGLTAATTVVASGSNVSTLDITTQSGAEATIRQIDAALTELSALQTEIGSASYQIDQVSSYLNAQQTSLTSALGNIIDADVAAETANLSAASIQAQTQIALLAQSQVQNSYILDLLMPYNR